MLIIGVNALFSTVSQALQLAVIDYLIVLLTACIATLTELDGLPIPSPLSGGDCCQAEPGFLFVQQSPLMLGSIAWLTTKQACVLANILMQQFLRACAAVYPGVQKVCRCQACNQAVCSMLPSLVAVNYTVCHSVMSERTHE